ncbi:transposase [Paenibacillus sp. FSL H8-0537]|uniref:transposase n=1 Tax=Paenibacillus sp. FSL H8-0537 TaxID=2921399 RepID=UPI00310123A9
MKRRFRCTVQTKKEFVVEVLLGYRIEVVARQHGLSPKTLGNWVRQYQDEVDDLMEKKQKEDKQLQQDAAQFQDLQKKYEDAVKLLGEKELEIHVLRDLVKKKYPDWK